MQKQVLLETGDGHIIYGTLDSTRQKSRRLIIFVHGLTGYQNEHHYFNAAPFFTERGFDTFRFDFYSLKERGRQLSECNLSVHVHDLSVVISRLREEYDELFLIGHSLGAFVILLSDISLITKLVLWDPTHGLKTLEEKNCIYDKRIGKYILRWGREILLGESMIKEWKKSSDLRVMVERITKPCKFVFAERHKSYTAWKPFLKYIRTETEFTFCYV